MSWLSKLFGGGTSASEPQSAPAIEYEGFRIIPEPVSEGGQFRLAGWIEKDVDGETRKHHFIRADMLRSHDDAVEAAEIKGKQMIDQMGLRLFD